MKQTLKVTNTVQVYIPELSTTQQYTVLECYGRGLFIVDLNGVPTSVYKGARSGKTYFITQKTGM